MLVLKMMNNVAHLWASQPDMPEVAHLLGRHQILYGAHESREAPNAMSLVVPSGRELMRNTGRCPSPNASQTDKVILSYMWMAEASFQQLSAYSLRQACRPLVWCSGLDMSSTIAQASGFKPFDAAAISCRRPCDGTNNIRR